MPLNELESHPFLTSINDQEFDPNYFKGLVIGSFPVYGITDTITPGENIISRFDDVIASMRYYYGSRKNSFWKIMADVFGQPNPAVALPATTRVEQAKNLLINQKLLISDSLKRTNRRGIASADSALMQITDIEFIEQGRSLNVGIRDLLHRNRAIDRLYFTSTELIGRSPFGWFAQIFGADLQWDIINEVEGRPTSAEVIINERRFVAFFLPSPAGNGSRGLHFTDTQRTAIFLNYIQSVDPEFFQEIDLIPKVHRTNIQIARLTQLRKDFLVETWTQAFVYHNFHFNGIV